MERKPAARPRSGTAALFDGGEQRRPLRASVQRSRQGAQSSGLGYAESARGLESEAHRGSGDEPPPAVHLRARGLCGQRLPYGVRARLRRRRPERRALRRQDPQRREAVGDSRRAADQVRARDQFKNREADRRDDPAIGALSGGSGDQVRNSKFALAIGALLSILGVNVFAQQPANVPHIGYLGAFTRSGGNSLLEGFQLGLRELGYSEGRNIVIDYRWADGDPNRMPALAVELIRLRVDVIVTQGNASVTALQQATRTVP